MIDRGLIERVPGPGRAVRHRLRRQRPRLRRAGDAVVDRVLAASFAPLTAPRLATFDELLSHRFTAPDDGGRGDHKT